MYKKDFRKVGGYFTVEASMVMPLVIAVIGMIFYLTFYLYDRCTVAQDTYILAFRGSLCCGSDAKEVKQYLEAESSRKYGKKYIGVAEFANRISVDGKTVTVAAEGSLGATGWHFGAKWQAQRLCPVDCVRKVRLAEKIKEGISSGTEKDKSKKDGIE